MISLLLFLALSPLPALAECATENSITEGSLETRNGSVSYQAIAGAIEVAAPSDRMKKACIFSTSYVVDAGSSPRPLIFAFNGGPGSASLWLHLGMLGPKRIDMGPEGMTPPQPFQLIPNVDSLLDVADIVMIDPVATGFSAPVDGEKNDPFVGISDDYQSIAEFIRNYLTEHHRWDAKKYVMGESYGGMRASYLVNHLQEEMGISISGIIFISPYLGEIDDDISYRTKLPTLAATAAYHHRGANRYQEMEPLELLQAAQTFARGPYASALQKGNELGEDEFHRIASEVAELTGIPQARVESLDLRVDTTQIRFELLQNQNQAIGRYDSRFTGGMPPSHPWVDPSDTVITGPYTAGINFYLREELKVVNPLPYQTFVGGLDWEGDLDSSPVLRALSDAMAHNPNLRIYAASGIYDLAVPFDEVHYTLGRLTSRLKLNERVEISQFLAGHMMYIQPSSLAKLRTELEAFIGR